MTNKYDQNKQTQQKQQTKPTTSTPAQTTQRTGATPTHTHTTNDPHHSKQQQKPSQFKSK